MVGIIGAFIGSWLLPRIGMHLGTGVVSAIYHLDSAVIDFELREAGKFGFRSERKFVDGPLVEGTDDGAFKVAFGNYDFRHNKLTLTFCGPNAR